MPRGETPDGSLSRPAAVRRKMVVSEHGENPPKTSFVKCEPVS